MTAPAGPFPAETLLSYLARRAVPGAEEVSPLAYRRGRASVTFSPFSLIADAEEAERLRFLFQWNRDWTAPEVFERDPVLGPLVRTVPGLRPLGCWAPFELCLRTIVGQQVSVSAAGTLMKRLGERAGAWTPEAVARANLDAMGMPGRRVATLRTLAERAAAGDLPWGAPWPDLREALARLPGFGPWTLDYLGIRLGRDLDAFPQADLGLIRLAGVRSPKTLLARAEAWRPYRGWAAAILWMS